MTELSLSFENVDLARSVFGERDRNISLVEDFLGIEIHLRGSSITVRGEKEPCEKAKHLLEELYDLAQTGRSVSSGDVLSAIKTKNDDPQQDTREIFLDSILVSSRGNVVTPKSRNQKDFVKAVREKDVVLAVGPAGTGKTFLAMAMAISALNQKTVDRIILTRPAVEAGEKLGFLPGDLEEKINPYLRPLYDALHDMVDVDRARRLVENGIIEIAPLAFMRGRTLNHSFIILDEAQNTTPEQMKMFLTRLGNHSKAVVNGDITQIDLPAGTVSGLVDAMDKCKDIKEIAQVLFTDRDVARHSIVRKILEAYQRAT